MGVDWSGTAYFNLARDSLSVVSNAVAGSTSYVWNDGTWNYGYLNASADFNTWGWSFSELNRSDCMIAYYISSSASKAGYGWRNDGNATTTVTYYIR